MKLYFNRLRLRFGFRNKSAAHKRPSTEGVSGAPTSSDFGVNTDTRSVTRRSFEEFTKISLGTSSAAGKEAAKDHNKRNIVIASAVTAVAVGGIFAYGAVYNGFSMAANLASWVSPVVIGVGAALVTAGIIAAIAGVHHLLQNRLASKAGTPQADSSSFATKEASPDPAPTPANALPAASASHKTAVDPIARESAVVAGREESSANAGPVR